MNLRGVGVLPSPYFSIISSRKSRGHPYWGGEGKVGRGLPSLDRQALLPTELLLFEEKSDAGGGAVEYAPYQHQVSARMISKIRGAF